MRPPDAARVTAVLGPTNTGKTHLAIERMLAHSDGMIGLPLRLLAREVYDKVVKAKGVRAAALITGEEKIAPETARYFVCTVEAMPLERRTQFLAVDEIQLAADPDRGHVFTDRILRARGSGETMLLGSDVMRPVLRRLAPEAEIVRRERFSTLSYAGARKITRLPKRTAIVAFSAEEVYAIAELIRRQRGGAAVVMGALSPRTRNAQVALYQSGEVDFLVATDAIGMGLNMDVDHVAFAAQAKFDGRRRRALRPDEIAQIAGRAGRFRTDGQFGETGDCPPLDEETVERVENHRFEPVQAVEWRSAALDFTSPAALLASLERPPDSPGLMRVRGALDEAVLKRVMGEEALMDRARGPAAVRRLWEACLIPDFRKTTPDEHARLVSAIAGHLLGEGTLPESWVAKELEKLDRLEGEMDALQARLAHVRTWSYIANRADWLGDAPHWRARARAIEDRLSDALHAALTQRFIDRRTSALMRGLTREEALSAAIAADGAVRVEGHYVGRLHGLSFAPDSRAGDREGKAVRGAAMRALRPEVNRRLAALSEGQHFRLARDATIWSGEAAVARLAPANPLRPQAALIGGEAGDPAARARAEAAVTAWLRDTVARRLAPLARLEAAARAGALSGAGRGLVFRLLEGAGALDRAGAQELAAALSTADRQLLARLGVRLGRHTIFLPALQRWEAVRLHAALRRAQTGGRAFLPARAALSAPCEDELTWPDYAAAGFRPAGPAAVRPAALERMAGLAQAARTAGGDFPLSEALAGAVGLPLAQMPALLRALGYRAAPAPTDPAPDGASSFWRAPSPAKQRPSPAPDNAFAPLAGLFLRKPGSAPS